MSLPHDYTERVYAGVLGKMIGVYIGRPFEGWTYERIMAELGEINYYVNERMPHKPPLVVTDDDLAGTFTFLRALPDYANSPDLSPVQIGQTWLNYIIEKRTILWWGGMGNSTEHTAYLRLKNGIPAPRSGSIELNGKVVAEQIGAQIFIDGWAMAAPGDPALAADLARRAASVSHDGEAIYGAQVLAAMEAQAFVEPNIDELIDTGLSFIPQDSVIARMIADIRQWRAQEPDWRKAFGRLAAGYGYDVYGGNCHMVPNHGLIILSLLYGDDDFQKTMMIVNTCGWDTDCNAGNAGCLMGIKNGLAGLDAGPDWRGPVADRLYLATADGGRAITDAVAETYHVANVGRALAGEPELAPKDGARFHFELPGSVQGFRPDGEGVSLQNVPGHSQHGARALALRWLGERGSAATPTFILPHELGMEGYQLLASPTLYSGQTVWLSLSADQATQVRPFIRVYDEKDALAAVYGPQLILEPDAYHKGAWQVPDTRGQPIAEIGLECEGAGATVYVDYLTWDGEPDVVLSRPAEGEFPWEPPLVWRRAWVDGMDQWDVWWREPYRLVQNSGRGLIIQGAREWTDYRVSADVTPHLVASAGIAARVQGMRRYYGLLLCSDGKVRLVKALDGNKVLAEANFDWRFGETHELCLQVVGTHVQAWVDGQQLFETDDTDRPLTGGAVALVCEQGRTATQAVRVCPAE